MTDGIRDTIEDRRTIFRTDGGRSDRWKRVKKMISGQVKKRKSTFNAEVIAKFDTETNPGRFFQHLNSLLDSNDTVSYTHLTLPTTPYV